MPTTGEDNIEMGEGKRLVVDAAGQLRVESFAVPEPEPEQILVRTHVTQVSAGSEMNLVRRRRQASDAERRQFADTGLGYTAVGRVAAVGANVTDYAVGDRVICNGNHASHWLVTPAAARDDASIPQQYYIDKLPDGIDDVEACFAILGDVALHGVRLAQLQIGESVAVHGLGVIGQLAVQLCRISGAHPVLGLDLVTDRLNLARELGADQVIHAGRQDPVAAIRLLTEIPWRWRGALPGLEPGAGADVQLHTTSNIQNYPDMIRAAADRGRIILIGATSGSVPIESQELFRREITIRGSYQTGQIEPHPYWPWSRPRNRSIILDLIARNQLQVEPLVSHVVPYTEAPALYDTMQDAGAGWLSVFFRWDDQ
jgi:threonine dehydrogenase-like Zn-dependent dehydrogenase